MDRFVSFLVVVAFIAQHFVCCCHGTVPRVCDHDRPVVDSRCVTVAHAKCCGHDHKPARSENLAELGDRTGIDPEMPGDESRHEHHLCVVAHTFFVQSPKAELPRSVVSTSGSLAAECSAMDSVAILGHGLHHSIKISLPITSQARRAAMCVYRI